MTLAIEVGEAVDPERGRLGASTVVLEGARIAAIRPGHGHDLGPVEVLDHRDRTMVPGLIDAHVHLNLRADGRLQETVAEPDGVLVAGTVAHARAALAAGITTVRDIGSKGRTTFDARDGAAASGLPMPRMLLAGPPVTITWGH